MGFGNALLRDVSHHLPADFGKGFTEMDLKYFRQFYLAFPPVEKSHAMHNESQRLSRETLRSKLGWTHYRLLLKVENEAARAWYLAKSVTQHWSTRTLERQINSFYYEQLLSSQQKEPVIAEAKEATDKLTVEPVDFIKDPFVLKFLNLLKDNYFQEKDLEEVIIENQQHFLLEFGKGCAFVAQQKCIRAGEDFILTWCFITIFLNAFY